VFHYIQLQDQPYQAFKKISWNVFPTSSTADGKYSDRATHSVPNIPAGTSSMYPGPSTLNDCLLTVRNNQTTPLSTEQDNAMDEFLGNLDDDECMEVLTTVENLGLCEMEG